MTRRARARTLTLLALALAVLTPACREVVDLAPDDDGGTPSTDAVPWPDAWPLPDAGLPATDASLPVTDGGALDAP
jgi:hypothetical protein